MRQGRYRRLPRRASPHERLAVRQRRCSAIRGPASARAGAHGRGEGLPARIQQCLSTQLSLLAQLFGIRHRSPAAAWCGTGQLAHAQAPVPVSPLGRTWGGSRAPARFLIRRFEGRTPSNFLTIHVFFGPDPVSIKIRPASRRKLGYSWRHFIQQQNLSPRCSRATRPFSG